MPADSDARGPDARSPDAAASRSAGPEALQLPAGVHQLCRCGLSRHGWFCDGAHLGSGQVSWELRLKQPTTVWMCRCGRSRQQPLCDGSHAAAARRPRWSWHWASLRPWLWAWLRRSDRQS